MVHCARFEARRQSALNRAPLRQLPWVALRPPSKTEPSRWGVNSHVAPRMVWPMLQIRPCLESTSALLRPMLYRVSRRDVPRRRSTCQPRLQQLLRRQSRDALLRNSAAYLRRSSGKCSRRAGWGKVQPQTRMLLQNGLFSIRTCLWCAAQLRQPVQEPQQEAALRRRRPCRSFEICLLRSSGGCWQSVA